MNYKTRIRLYLAIVAFCFVAFAVFAQVTITNLQPELTGADKAIADTVAKFSYWQGMLLPITMVLVAAIKKWVAFIPDKFLPWTAPIIGGLLDMTAQKFGLWTGNPAVGAAMGGLATWFHQAFKQLEFGKELPSEPPKTGLFLLIACLSLSLTGCASVVQTATTTSTNPTNGVVTVTEARSSIYATGDAKTIVDKVRASAGKTSSVGASGVSEETTSAAPVAMLQAILEAAFAAGKKAAGP